MTAVFDFPIRKVSIQSQDNNYNGTGETWLDLWAYNNNGDTIAFDETFHDGGTGGIHGVSVSLPNADIASIEAWPYPFGTLDDLRYSSNATVDVYLDTTNPPTTVICADTVQGSCHPGTLQPFTTYYWQVVVKGTCQGAGPIWSFTTRECAISDVDCDGVLNADDNCPDDPNVDQWDVDLDGSGDVCDNCPNDSNATQDDQDTDGVGDVCDNCPNDANVNQTDYDGDGLGNACDTSIPADNDGDFDVDGVDFSVFASCFNKAGNPPRTAGCNPAAQNAFDFDADNDVDGVDFAVFASCYNGAGNPPRTLGCPKN